MARIFACASLFIILAARPYGLEAAGGRAGQNPTARKGVSVQAWEILTAGVTSEKASKRTDAIAALGTIGPRPEVITLIEAALSDKDFAVRQVAAATLGEMKSRRSIPKLKRALEDETPEVCFTAARALWEMGDRSGRDIFLEVLAGERSASVGLVHSSMRDAKKKLHSPLTLALIGVNEGADAFLGPFALGISVAEELAKDRSAPARAFAAMLLGEDRDPQSVQHLVEALSDRNWVVRAAAAKALGKLSRQDSIPKLEPLLRDGKDAVRYMAAASIVRLSRTGSPP